ncbi:MAG: phosphoglycolate phosphatase, partial [Klebsiella sp.]|nr:phosphoglycolate phosphatase [Klebsiella sp.]
EEQVRILRKLFDRYYGEVAEEGTFLFPHVADTLGALQAKGLPLGLVTNKPTPFVAPLLEALDIAKYFSVVIGGDDVQNKKPHPEPLLMVAEKLGLAPAELLFVGDSRNDIQAAKAAGCRSIGLTYGYNYGEPISQSEPDYIFDQFNELLPAFGLPYSETQE